MHLRLLELLACPKCLEPLVCAAEQTSNAGEVIKGDLCCLGCARRYPIQGGIPRFETNDNYASSFGLQWNLFRNEQIDSRTGKRISRKRFFAETGWTEDWLPGKWILDAGCGAGRFLDVLSEYPCQVVGVDISNAVDAAASTLSGCSNVHLVQASILELPFRRDAFDACYSIGVIQHTPDPPRALESLPRFLKPGGKVAVTIYERKSWTRLNAKYLVRPITRRMNPRILLFLIKAAMPVLFPLTELLFRLPLVGRLFSFVLPVADYTNFPELSLGQRYRGVILDTFDMLSPQFDLPQTREEAESALARTGVVNIQRLGSVGVNLVGQRDGAG